MAAYLLGLFTTLVNTLGDMLKDLFAWGFDQILSLAQTVMGVIPVPDFSAFNPGTYISALPPSFTSMLHYIHFDAAIAMVISALVVRVLLQLIPFTRLGS